MRSLALRAAGLGAALGLTAGIPSVHAQAADQMSDSAMTAKEYRGAFHGIKGHDAEGHYTLIQRDGRYVVEFGEDFGFDRIPDGYVVLSNQPDAIDSTSVFVAKFTKRRGAQSYAIPEGTDPGRFRYVLVWCKKYSVPVGAAPI